MSDEEWSGAALAYLRKHREYVQRDLDRLKAGQVRVIEAGEDVTPQWIGRYERQLGHIDRLLSGVT